MSCKDEGILGVEILFDHLLSDEYKRIEFHFIPVILLSNLNIISKDPDEEEIKCVKEKIKWAKAIASERSQFPPLPLFHRTHGKGQSSNLVSVPLIHQLTPRSQAIRQ